MFVYFEELNIDKKLVFRLEYEHMIKSVILTPGSHNMNSYWGSVLHVSNSKYVCFLVSFSYRTLKDKDIKV